MPNIADTVYPSYLPGIPRRAVSVTNIMDNGVDVEKQAAGHGATDDVETESPTESQPLNDVKVEPPTAPASSTNRSASTPKTKVKEVKGKQCTCCPCCTCSRAVVLAAVGVMFMVGDDDAAAPQGDVNTGESSFRRAVGGVAADHTACSEVGRDILAEGGSAVDAAIAALVCVGVRQPHSMGIGGGLFLAVYKKDPHTVEMYDGRETAPAAATYDTYFNKSFNFGPLSVGVPGEVLAYWEAHQKHGRLPWSDLFQPTIRMAADGHPLSHSTARALGILKSVFKYDVENNAELCKMFCDESGKLKKEGDTIFMPALARTLQGIADFGPEYLYSPNSSAAINLTRDIEDMGGLVTLSDLEQYKVVKAPPVSTSLGDLTLHTLTAPSGGPVMALVLKILHGLNLGPEDLKNATTKAAMWHKVVESFKYAYADRLKLGDPAYVNVSQLLEKMASPEYADYLRDAIDPERTYSTDHYTNISVAPWREEGTTHISHHQLLFRVSSASPNYIAPGKRPLSSMAPAIIVDKDGNPRLVLGSAGGARITTINAQVTARVLWLKQTLEKAINAKRLHHQLFPNHISWEQGFPQDILGKLKEYGHELVPRTSYMAVVQAVSRDPLTGEVTAFSDPRKHAEARLLYEDEVDHDRDDNNNKK
ncbi:hypothetical protein BaRGS_00022351 [Batillaria attramentaria]|uniref:Uncharacterized protein n=1 Tax=Batillaria attramentaria TaxID=370345 RepID=A0ABD0KHN1_9CAEN